MKDFLLYPQDMADFERQKHILESFDLLTQVSHILVLGLPQILYLFQ